MHFPVDDPLLAPGESSFRDLATYAQPLLEALSTITNLRCLLANPSDPRAGIGTELHEFCARFGKLGGTPCERFHSETRQRAASQRTIIECSCPAGFTHLVMPVAAGGNVVALLEAGRAFSEHPAPSHLSSLVRPSGTTNGVLARLRHAYFDTPVLDTRKLDAGKRILSFVAEGLGAKALDLSGQCCTEPVSPVARARAYILKNFACRLTRTEIARRAGVSIDHLTRLFRQQGSGVSEYIHFVRIQHARRLLSDVSLRISEISFACGYESIPNFNRQFVKLTGFSPSQFRKKWIAARKA